MQMRRKDPLIERNIVLIGFMGVGKTSIGRELAKRMYRDFIDVDHVIEEKVGCPPTEIFAKYGEPFFREQERNVVRETCGEKMKIIALGGGAFMQEEIREQCLSDCIVIFLDITFDSWKDRVNLLIDSRPVLQGKTLEEMEALYEKRRSAYESYHSKFDTDHLQIEEIALYLKESLHLAWELDTPLSLD
ncbi:shikimate kinase [Shouchella shacheensis]|uniref:shikimate kinase n=1 Tax=Shouchella shacheensis TaxID=1649580 RepID=UPI00073FDA5F|nr:shikimate kinase [Shouchella shacheensis]